ncbi:hypothetical protein EC957_000130 [Mortierella hygrophila]|uniref:Uncharacterized protein n=1 Tax=Mortierella hygrophila TaxID=979708 RepID=A0A9P6FIU9_9FUNG|nr:hypothetical protein EC957_000003 [Mortierella hygrophila]KAF9552057.1 hypothetical protein EC957_000130 [Mortierella hygrophila]
MGVKSNRAKQLKEARDRKKLKLYGTIDPTSSANTERQANEEAYAGSDSNSDPESEINDIQRNMVIMVDEVGRYLSARTKDGSLSKSGQESLEAVQQYLRPRIRGVKRHSAANQITVIRERKVGYLHWRCPIDCYSRPF